MAVTSKSYGKRLDVTTAPIHADDLDGVGAVLRLLIGLGMIGYSIATTALIFSRVLAPVLTSGLDLGFVSLSWGFLIGVGFGSLITVCEWVTTTRAPLVHWLLVIFLDAPFSAGQTALWLFVIAAAYEASTGWYVALIAFSIAWGVFVAKVGEKLLITKD